MSALCTHAHYHLHQGCTYLTHVLYQKVLSLTKPKGMNRNPSAIILQIQFSICHFFGLILNVKQFYFTYRSIPIRCYHSEPTWTMELSQWRDTLHPRNSSITGVSSSDCLVSYRWLSLGEPYPSLVLQSVYSTAPTTGLIGYWFVTVWLFYVLFKFCWVWL